MACRISGSAVGLRVMGAKKNKLDAEIRTGAVLSSDIDDRCIHDGAIQINSVGEVDLFLREAGEGGQEKRKCEVDGVDNGRAILLDLCSLRRSDL